MPVSVSAGVTRLPARLRAVAALVPPGARVADVGCGDGHLTAHLRSAGHSVIPTELAGPGARTRARLGDCRVGDGLSVLAPDEVDVVVLAGIGGRTLRGILEAGGPVIAGASLLLLQPMAPIEPLLQWLSGRLEVLEDVIAVDRGRPYRVLAVRGGRS